MRLIKNIPIRILYPVFMFVGLFVLILFQYHTERSQTLDKIRLTYMDNAKIVGDNIQQILEFLLAKEHMEMVDKVIATYSAQENIELIALVDHRNVVVSSSKRELKGSIYDKPNKWKGCSMQDVRIVCIYKVLYAQNVEGAVHVVFNLEREFKEANLMLMKKFLLNVLVLSLITYILYLFTDSLIIKELDQILTFLKASSSKEGSTEKMSGDGKNEFATIKRAINEAWETIWKLANTDHLTGLYNRRKMESLYEGELLNAKRPIFMALIDLDNFKDINDLFGHDFGDMLLVEFSKRLLEEGKKRGFYAGRFGGDEFLLMGEAESHIGLRES
ncbi:MAG: GGDEF domain-containing protein [Aquificaceae bacterium]|nr:GGDEF domain-containing protein [Aquificaceae bacterium]